jgi:diguanylate cyclase (GGDEF)-like protein
MPKSTRRRPEPQETAAARVWRVAVVGSGDCAADRFRRLLAAGGGAGRYTVTGDPDEADLVVACVRGVSLRTLPARAQSASNPRTRVPLLVIAHDSTSAGRAAILQAGADDCVDADVSGAELRARVTALLRRCECDRAASPLTGLPGNVQLEEELRARLANGRPAALMAFDLRDFKPFNDRYGYVRGDEVLKFLAGLLVGISQSGGCASPVYHIGGDDFFVIAGVEEADRIATAAVAMFDAQIHSFYDREDTARGFMAGVDRLGRPAHFPLMALFVAAVTWGADETPHVGELARTLATIKEAGRKRKGSVFLSRPCTDQRS